MPAEDPEMKDLSDIYDVLKGDATQIVKDLRMGVLMWREASGACIAAAGFLFLLALTSYRYYSYDYYSYRYYSPLGFETTAIILAQVVLAIALLGFATYGLKKYLGLQRKYKGLFEKAKKLE